VTETKKRQKLVLLDAHAIIHRAYHALPQFASSKGEPTGALYGLCAMVLKIAKDLKPDFIIAAYDLPKPTHRHEVYKDYKAGRKKTDEELISQLQSSRDVLRAFSIPIYDKEGFEADDILGTIVDKTKNNKDLQVVIASGDMDTLQLVSDDKVMVYTLKKGINDTILYNEEAVVKRFGFSPKLIPDYKGLSGDQSDNIIGIKGIGDKTTTSLITNFGSIEKIYETLEKDEKKFLELGFKPRIIELLKAGKEEAEFSKILASIRTDAPIDFNLPEKKWIDSVDFSKAQEIFSKFEFRTMGDRLKEIVNGKSEITNFSTQEKVIENKKLEDKKILGNEDLLTMLWLVNSSITDPSIDDVLNFSNTDSLAEARKFLERKIKEMNLGRVFEEIEKPLTPVVEKMNKTGIAVDIEHLKTLKKKYSLELSTIEKKIWKMTGTEFNIASPKQLGEILFVKLGLKAKGQKKTPGGSLSTKESELLKLIDQHEVIPLIVKYRELAKVLSTYIENVIPMVGLDGRLYTRFIQLGTTTGRMSSENPNLQNIPNHTEMGKEIRKAFISQKGFSLLSLDYSQIELRIAAIISKDENLINIFKHGKDIHSSVASSVFGVPLEKVDKEMRRRAKVINFGVMYGMGVNALRQQLALDSNGLPIEFKREDAQKFYNDYFEKFSGLARYLEETKKSASKLGYTETLFGRRRYFEGINSKLPFIRASAERMAINAPIQGTEADIIKLAMVKIDEFLSNKGLSNDVRLILQVHDELVYEVKDSVVNNIWRSIKDIMESCLPKNVSEGVPIVTDTSIGKSWGEMEKIK
jgi:DNA polymerase-1